MPELLKYRLFFSCWPKSYSERLSELCVDASQIGPGKRVRLTFRVHSDSDGKVDPFSAQVIAAVRGISGCCGLDVSDSHQGRFYDAFGDITCETGSFTADRDQLTTVYILSEADKV